MASLHLRLAWNPVQIHPHLWLSIKQLDQLSARNRETIGSDLHEGTLVEAEGLLACTCVFVEEVADALAVCGTATSSPSTAGVAAAGAAFFAIAFGSNFPAYSSGVMSLAGTAGDCGESTAGDTPDFWSISSNILFGSAAAADSRCFRSFSAACFCFHASNLASLSARFSSSVGPFATAGVDGFDAWHND